jgi:transposase-like protein
LAIPRAHLEEVYGLKVSADLISRVTDAVLEEVTDWQNRALEPMYPIVFLDALRVKIRDAESRQVKNKAVYVLWGSLRRANGKFWVYGSPIMKGPNSGSVS